MIESIRDQVATWVDTLNLEAGVSAEPVWVPVLDRKDINETRIIVSPASNSPERRTRSTIDNVVEIDIAIVMPLGTDAATACQDAVGYAGDIVEAAFDLKLTAGRCLRIEQPIIIDQDYYRNQNVALSVVRLTIRTY